MRVGIHALLLEFHMRHLLPVVLLALSACATSGPRRASLAEALEPPRPSALAEPEEVTPAAEPATGPLTQGTFAGVLLGDGQVRPAVAVLPSLKLGEAWGRDVSVVLPLGGALDVASGGAVPVAGLGLTVGLTPQRAPVEVGLGAAAVCELSSGCTEWRGVVGLTIAKP